MELTQTHAEILKFIIADGINTLNYYVVYLLLLKLLHIKYMISHITGLLVAFVASYYLNCYFIYKVKSIWRKLTSLPIMQIVSVGLQTILLYVSVSWLNLPAEIIPLAGLIITMPITLILPEWILKDSN